MIAKKIHRCSIGRTRKSPSRRIQNEEENHSNRPGKRVCIQSPLLFLIDTTCETVRRSLTVHPCLPNARSGCKKSNHAAVRRMFYKNLYSNQPAPFDTTQPPGSTSQSSSRVSSSFRLDQPRASDSSSYGSAHQLRQSASFAPQDQLSRYGSTSAVK